MSLILECRASEKVFSPVDSFRFALERVGVVGGLVSVTDPLMEIRFLQVADV